MGTHDHAYKILFAYKRMVRDLLEGFVNGDWLSQLDFNTLDRVNASYVSDDLRSRADDIVWRIRCGDLDVYLLIEFQSTDEPFMAVRVLTYEGLLFQELIRTRIVTSGDELPAVLPIVLYNGQRRWSAPEDLASLFSAQLPQGLAKYIPQCRYLLIDESRFAEEDPALAGNAVAALFRLEHCQQRDRIPVILGQLMDSLGRDDQDSLRRAFRIWLSRVFFVRQGLGGGVVSDLWEDQAMLAERVKEWEAELLLQGRQEGRQEGELALLRRQLRKRFGELPPWVSGRIAVAQPEQIECWGERLLEARSLDDVFDC